MGVTESKRANAAGRLLRYGMVGGGPGSFIGDVHRKALALDGMAVLKAGCFSSRPKATRSTGESLGLEADRLYDDWREMAKAEASREDGIDFVVVVTPNHLHAPVAKAFLESGISVACDKPLAVSSAECRELEALAGAKGLEFCVTYTYSGYAAVKEASAIVAEGTLGEIRFVKAEYPQEFFAGLAEAAGNKQAEWRFDPARSGPVGTLGDVGTHVEHLVSYITGLRLKRLAARLGTIVPGRRLDDTATVMTEYEGGAAGLYWACQAAPGEGNDLNISVYGTLGALSWRQEEPEILRIGMLGEAGRIWRRGRDSAHPMTSAFSRFPAGHPEGFLEAFANIYRAYCSSVSNRVSGIAGSPGFAGQGDYPRVSDGTSGILFCEACLASSRTGSTWIDL